jgi:hypothetical protein
MEKNLKRLRRILIIALIWAILIPVSLELLLRCCEPSGVIRYRYDSFLLQRVNGDDPRGYSPLPGVHDFSNWRATINEDRTRYTPDTNTASPYTVAFIGDSVTFGFGVNDAEVWVNRLAAALPDWHVINTGVSGFNSVQALRSIDVYPADAYVWLTIENDIEGIGERIDTRGLYPTYLSIFIRRLRFQDPPTVPDDAHYQTSQTRYLEDVRGALKRGVLVLVFADTHGQWLKEQVPDVVTIPRFTERISAADGHANVVGNQQIADAAHDIITEWLRGKAITSLE